MLKLPSSLKDSPAGFSRYYSERERQLGEISEGAVSIRLEHRSDTHGNGGRLLIRVEDSGEGFPEESLSRSLAHDGLSGRGLALVRQLCNNVRLCGHGNCIEAECVWHAGRAESRAAVPEGGDSHE